MNNLPKQIYISEGDCVADIQVGIWSTKQHPLSNGPYILQPKPLLKWRRKRCGIFAKYKNVTFEVDTLASGFSFYCDRLGYTSDEQIVKKQSTAKQVAELIAREL